jgi:phage baseplate assembly protein W
MSTYYYKIPFQFSAALEGHELPFCNLNDSISKNIELIIMTKYGEHRNNPTFGCGIWDLDFELITSKNLWEERLRQSLLASIHKHEGRLSDAELAVTITDLKKQYAFNQFPEIKKSVSIQLKATIKKTGTEFSFFTSLYLSPLSKN